MTSGWRHEPEAERDDELEPMLIYRAFGIADEDMDLLLQLAFVSPMCLDGKLCVPLADLLEAMHPHHAGAFIVRGMRAQAEGRFQDALECYLTGMEADLKSEEAAVFALRMLDELSLAASDVAYSVRDFLSHSARGLAYLAERDGGAGGKRMINGSGQEAGDG